MKDHWYGDKRDLVKWGALIHLARENGITNIIQVAFLRRIGNLPTLLTSQGEVTIAAEVWTHFRDVAMIKGLGYAVGMNIILIADEYRPAKRADYVQAALETTRQMGPGPKIVFLDPDTGIAPARALAEHVKDVEIQAFWSHLVAGDWLALYQHAPRQRNWLESKRASFARICGLRTADVRKFTSPAVARDVVFFAACKS